MIKLQSYRAKNQNRPKQDRAFSGVVSIFGEDANKVYANRVKIPYTMFNNLFSEVPPVYQRTFTWQLFFIGHGDVPKQLYPFFARTPHSWAFEDEKACIYHEALKLPVEAFEAWMENIENFLEQLENQKF